MSIFVHLFVHLESDPIADCFAGHMAQLIHQAPFENLCAGFADALLFDDQVYAM